MTTTTTTASPSARNTDASAGTSALAPVAQRSAPCSPVRRGARAMRALASDVGQGTVEYVGLLLLMATVLAALVGAAKGLGGEDQIGKKVVQQVGKSIDKAGSGSGER